LVGQHNVLTAKVDIDKHGVAIRGVLYEQGDRASEGIEATLDCHSKLVPFSAYVFNLLVGHG
jgi:hypothetical protein